MDKHTKGRQRRGRPPLPLEKAKRHAIGIRTTKELKDLLQREADSAGRSMAQEIERRLEQSFQAEDALGGARTAAVLRTFAEFVKFQQGPYRQDDEWLGDRSLFNEVVDLWEKHLEQIKPKEHELDRAERHRELAEFKKLIDSASPEGARTLRTWAAINALSTILDRDERAEWAALASCANPK